MADNREYKKVANGIYETHSHDGKKEYIATFRCNAQRFNKKNLTKLFDATTLSQAKTALSDVKAEIRKGNNPFEKIPYKKDKKFSDYMNEIIDSKKGEYQTNIRVFNEKHLKSLHKKRLEDISRLDIIEIINKLKEKGYASSYINNVKRYVGFVFNEAMKNDIIQKSPTQFVKGEPKAQRDVRALTNNNLQTAKEFYQAILEIKNFKYSVYFLMLLFTCRRMGELLKLEWTDIDLMDNTIFSRAEITKTKKIQPWSIPQPLLNELRKLRAQYPKDTFIFQSDYVTNISNGKISKPVNNTLISFEKKKLLPKIKSLKNGEFHTHDFRHLGSSLLIELDIHPFTIQEVLSHQNKSITGIYSRATKDKTLEALEKLYDYITKG
ncbi:tyrosine-type recombinase/integrase [Sulfurospirillum cavolei]|uniref:tyrosine-type recombinase/integrase n=1 Tax=Sulfurospirillum cavolei TaxID=366522 RepID=UPI003FA2FB42